MTIRKRMRAKLRQIKQQLRKRMHDLVAQTGAWLKSVVQGYFNYYAVPGNFDSLNAFRTQVSRFWRTLLRRSQKRHFNWAKMRKLIDYWIPKPRVLHPLPRGPLRRHPSEIGAVCGNERPYGSARGASGN